MKKRIILLLLCVLTLSVSLCLFTGCDETETPDNDGGTTDGGTTEGGGTTQGGTTENGGGSSSEGDVSSDGGLNGGTAEPAKTSEGLEYELSSDGTYYTVTGKGSCSDTDIVIPSTYENKPVTSIDSSAFDYCYNLTSVVIPDSVTSIGGAAFYFCDNLTSVVIGKGVNSIDSSAFDNCNKLVEVINKSSLNITSVSEDNGNVGEFALEIHNGESKIVNKDGYLFITYDGVNYLLGYVGTDTALTLPSDYNGENYEVYEYAFRNNFKITSVVIPDSVTSIGFRAFYHCSSLTSVVIGNSVTSIGDLTFDYCYKLVEVINKSSLNITKESSSNGCVGVYSLEIHNGESKIVNKDGYLFITSGGVNYLLGYTGIDTALTLPNGFNGENYEIYKYAFYNNDKITSVVIPDSVTSIGWSAFEACRSLTSVVIPDNVTSIGSYAFLDCSSLTIKYKGTEIQWDAITKGYNWKLFSTTVTYNYTGE